MKYVVQTTVVMTALVANAFAAETANPVPLHVTENGTIERNGVPYRGIGINYFSAFVRTLHDPADTSYDGGFQVLADHEIPFVRFAACGFWPNDFKLYREDKEAYFRLLDGVVKSAEAHGIGLIPSLFWAIFSVPDLVGEPVSAWGDAASKTRAFMRTYTQEVVTRYVDSPAIWAWEFGNEYSLAADLPKAGEHFPPVVPNLGTPGKRSDADAVTSTMINDALRDFAETIRPCDKRRPITSGHSLPRPAAWHLQHDGTWDQDTREQFSANLHERRIPPANLVSVHVYPPEVDTRFDGTYYEELLDLTVSAAHSDRCAVFVGEFGALDDEAHGGADKARRHVLDQIGAIERSGVDLAALWVFDLPNQEETVNVTAENKRKGLLHVLKLANRRLKTLAQGEHAVDLENEAWSGRLYDNAGNQGREGAGFNPLWHRAYPGESLFRLDAVGLNFEHIFNGVAQDKERSMFTPRRDDTRLEVHSPISVTVHWPAEGSSWGMECSMRYTLANSNAVDMEFRAMPREDHYGLGFAALMWASYMNHTRDRKIHFYGTRNGEEGWLAFGEDTHDGFETGTVACVGVSNLPYEDGSQTLNLIEHPTKRFSEPFYYGLVDGDGDYTTDADTMAYIMMFDRREPIRFAMWNFIQTVDRAPDPHSPAWDWQYVIQSANVGETYTYRARMLYKPFIDQDDTRNEYEAWAESLSE